MPYLVPVSLVNYIYVLMTELLYGPNENGTVMPALLFSSVHKRLFGGPLL